MAHAALAGANQRTRPVRPDDRGDTRKHLHVDAQRVAAGSQPLGPAGPAFAAVVACCARPASGRAVEHVAWPHARHVAADQVLVMQPRIGG